MEYYVLKQGRQEGPFTGAELLNQLAQGRFTPNDLGQSEGERHWIPLRKLISAQGEKQTTPPPLPATRQREDASRAAADKIESVAETETPAAPEPFEVAGKRFWREVVAAVRHLFRQYPFEVGLTCFFAGCSILLLSYFRVLIVAPVLVGGLIGGGMAMLRGRVLSGLLLCAATVFIPAAIWAVFFWGAQLLR